MATPREYPDDAEPVLRQVAVPGVPDWTWSPMCRQACGFGPDAFDAVMQNLLRNPNQLSSWLFRADMVATGPDCPEARPAPVFAGFTQAADRTLVRRLVPRNTMRDDPMLQTCLFYERTDEDEDEDEDDHHEAAHNDHDEDCDVRRSLVVYVPHADAADDVPFYHPKVRAVGFLHEWRGGGQEDVADDDDDDAETSGLLSIHFALFPETAAAAAVATAAEAGNRITRPVLARVALNLLQTIRKHGNGRRRGYVKRVHHDRLVPQARVQDRYTRLKQRHARRLVQGWQETTDPAKHVFEDLAIAAFLLELWADMYGPPATADGKAPPAFPGFVDVGCGNGLLVHVLHAEGYGGWGFDARRRRSWEVYGRRRADDGTDDASLLQERLLLPFFLSDNNDDDDDDDDDTNNNSNADNLHDGRFPPGTFIIANHADELTAWTPLLAALAGCPFLAIPCCSHNFTGAKFRAAPPAKDKPTKDGAAASAAAAVSVDLAASSTYASFVAWVTGVAEACGWAVELEMLRIPSTRNAGLVGRRGQTADTGSAYPSITVDRARDIVAAHGGAHGFADNVAKLAQSSGKH